MKEKDNYGFLVLLTVIIIFYIFIFFLFEIYFNITDNSTTRDEKKEQVVIRKPLNNVIMAQNTFISSYLEDINMSYYLKDSNISAYLAEYNITGPQKDLMLENLAVLHGDNLYKVAEDLNISLTDIIFETNRFTTFLIVHQARQLIESYKLYSLKRGLSPSVIEDLVKERILTMVPEQHKLVTVTGWTLSDNTNVGVDNVAFILNLDGFAVDEIKLDFCNIVNFYAIDGWSLQASEADIIALGSGKTILDNGYASFNDTFFCYSTGTTGDYDFQLVFAKKNTN